MHLNLTYFLFVILFLLIIYYFNLRNTYKDKDRLKEGFIFGKIKNSFKNMGNKIKKPAALSLDGYNAAIIQVISKATDQSSVQSTTQTYTSGIKSYFEEAYKTNLKLTDAGAALGEDEFQTKSAEGIAAITKGGIKEFTKWFNIFTTPVEVPAEVPAE